jgi:hypothetical protein
VSRTQKNVKTDLVSGLKRVMGEFINQGVIDISTKLKLLLRALI